jgi:hypothetical protein
VMAEQEQDKISERELGRRAYGFEFLEDLPAEEKDEELEVKRKEGRKRKRESEAECQDEGLLGTAGWRRREVESRTLRDGDGRLVSGGRTKMER